MTEFISRKYGNDCYEVIIKTDSHEHYKASEDFARRLIDHAKPITKADRIRAMSDEELAEYFAEIGNDASNGISYSENPEEWLEWLQQPAEE